MSENEVNSLIQKYHLNEFKRKKSNIKNMTISNEELVKIINAYNLKMQNMINDNPNNIENNDILKELFYINISLYRLAKYREIKVDNISFMKALATSLNYDISNTILEENDLTKVR